MSAIFTRTNAKLSNGLRCLLLMHSLCLRNPQQCCRTNWSWRNKDLCNSKYHPGTNLLNIWMFKFFCLNLMTENYFYCFQHYAHATTCTFLGKLLSCILLPFYDLMHFWKLSLKNVMIWMSLVMSFHVKDIERIFFPHWNVSLKQKQIAI